MRNHVDEGEAHDREFIFLCVDLGAKTGDDLLNPAIHPLAPLGHEEACMIRACSKFMVAILDREIISIIPEFHSDKGRDMLAEGACLHKSMQALRVFQRAVTSALAFEYTQSEGGDGTVEAFEAWLRSRETDAIFDLHARFFVLETLPALFAYRAGCRRNCARQISAARKALLPFLAARGAVHYYRFIIHDTVRTEYQCTRAVRRLIETHRTYKGQGFDYKLEESNSQVKSLLCADTEIGWKTSSVMARCAKGAFELLKDVLGFDNKNGSTRSRREPDTSELEKSITQAIIDLGTLHPMAVGDARKQSTLRGKPLLMSFSELMAEGAAIVETYFKKLREVRGARLLRPLWIPTKDCCMTESERKKSSFDARVRGMTEKMTDEEIIRAYELRGLDVGEDGDAGEDEL